MAEASRPSKPSKTLHDGDTSVKVDVQTTPNPNTNKNVPLDFRNARNEALKNQSGVYPPCINPSCKSYGRSHPNCLCFSPGGEAEQIEKNILGFANGGEVGHYCSQARMHNPECEHFAEGGDVEDNQSFAEQPGLAIDHHIAAHGLLHTLTKTGYSKSEDPDRVHTDFLDGAHRGKKIIEQHTGESSDLDTDEMQHNEQDVHDLGEHISKIKQNPDMIADIGGDIGDRFPAHQVQLYSKAANIVQYLDSIKPMNSQGGPLDPLNPPSKAEKLNYKRQMILAQHPTMIYQRAKDGVIVPQDIQTITTLYPDLANSIKQKAMGALIDSESSGKKLTRKQRVSMSQLIGEPLSFYQTPQAMQAIIQANAGAEQRSQQEQPGGGGPKASAAELKQINEYNKLDATQLQARLMDRKG